MNVHPDRGPLVLVDADEEYGRMLRRARLQVGLTQDDLAARAGLCDGSSVARIERGKRRPRFATQKRLAKVIEELQEAQVRPRMHVLILRLVEFDEQIRVAGTPMPAAWAEIMEQVHAEAAVADASIGRVSQLRPHLKLLDR